MGSKRATARSARRSRKLSERSPVNACRKCGAKSRRNFMRGKRSSWRSGWAKRAA